MNEPFAERPLLVAIAGPNGAGKSTFYDARLRTALGLSFVNADEIALEHGLGAYAAAEVAERLRRELISMKESFAFETVFSDPEGAKVAFLREAAERGYNVVLCFIGIDGAATSDERVAMRALQGGHDVPTQKLRERYPRTMQNLTRALEQLPNVIVYDNTDLAQPYREVLRVFDAKVAMQAPTLPSWLTIPERLAAPHP